jgi:NDP-sugar pyrophosphorylase family protein
VVDDDKRLLGVITDGDIRRTMLANMELTLSSAALLQGKRNHPISATIHASHKDLVALVRKTKVSHIPILDDAGCVVDLVGLDDLLLTNGDPLPVQAVVMAGGYGTRLQPLTTSLPKPMLPVGERPLMERIIRQFSQMGIRQVNITTHYLGEKITEYFGDGTRFGVEMKYVPEEELLGTAGGLGLMPTPDTPMLVINGDILTDVDFRAMFAFHKEHNADLTVAVRQHDMQVPYGVINSDGPYVREVIEKPMQKFFINAGIYLVEPLAHRLIPKGQRFDMTDLIQRLLEQQRVVVSFPIWEYWRDIGQHSDYEQAQDDVKNGKLNV